VRPVVASVRPDRGPAMTVPPGEPVETVDRTEEFDGEKPGVHPGRIGSYPAHIIPPGSDRSFPNPVYIEDDSSARSDADGVPGTVGRDTKAGTGDPSRARSNLASAETQAEHTLIDHIEIVTRPVERKTTLNPRWTTPMDLTPRRPVAMTQGPKYLQDEPDPEYSGLTDRQLEILLVNRMDRFTKAVSGELTAKRRVQEPQTDYDPRRPEKVPSSLRGPQPEETTPEINAGEADRWQTPAASRPSRLVPSTGGATPGVTARTLVLVVTMLAAASALLGVGVLESNRMLTAPESYLGPIEMFVAAIVLTAGCVVTAWLG